MRMYQLPSLNQEPMDEECLLSKVQEYLRIRESNGKPEGELISAWGKFYLLQNARLQRFAKTVKMPSSERDDVVQDVWREIVEKVRGFQGDCAIQKLHFWMYKLIRSKTALVIRRRAARPTRSLHDLFAEPEDSREKSAKEQELGEKVWQLFLQWLKSLAEKEQLNYALMRGRFVEEREVQEMAKTGGLSASAVSGRLKRLKERFRIWLSRCEQAHTLRY